MGNPAYLLEIFLRIITVMPRENEDRGRAAKARYLINNLQKTNNTMGLINALFGTSLSAGHAARLHWIVGTSSSRLIILPPRIS